MDAKHQIIAQLLLKWQESLAVGNLAEVRAIQEEIAYVYRAKGSIKLRELERIRLRFGLHSNQIEAIEAVNHALPISPPSKREKEAQLRLLRFCVHCDTELQHNGERFFCPNRECKGLAA